MSEKRTIGTVTKTSAGSGALAGAVTVFIVWLVGLSGLQIPAEVSAALTVIIGFAGGILGGWLVKPGTGKRVE